MKVANLAALRSFKLPGEPVPDGFGLPFSFYDDFMKHNGFYALAERTTANAEFKRDRSVQIEALAKLRGALRAGDFPDALFAEIGKLQASFPAGAKIRCRSSTNNEDLPGFSGAGLYDSYTHEPSEGHLAKTIKQVFASLWTFRAFEERSFYRIDHMTTAMGVLVHQNFAGEVANGVAVTDDVLYQTDGYYYVNTQVGEDLVTNPEAQSAPEEMLIDWWEAERDKLMRRSNRTEGGAEILTEAHRKTLRSCLGKIHAKFAKLYGVDRESPQYAMEVEFKITADGKLAIKQARPWVY